ncbi:MAG: hypothetical protein C0448_03010 [Sphingobacteriaceae bacterium]|nr:hypothetical protein [Sphingobacteriaceae bacterium]
MKKILILLFSVLTFFSCKKEEISVEGYLVDEKTGNHFNPYNNASIRLVVDQSYGYYDELGSCAVDQSGYYKITTKNKNTGFKARLQLNIEEQNSLNHDIDHFITVGKNVQHDFIITCPVILNRVITNQTSISFDSIRIDITNSNGTETFRHFLYSNITNLSITSLKGGEKNYLKSYIYGNGLFDTHYDTIFISCRTVVSDSLKY